MKMKLLDILDWFNQQIYLQSSANRSRHARFLRIQTNQFAVSGFQEILEK